MTHYEELGVSPDAPAEEIRRAFRRTSRLLHPDFQSAPELREAAEVQMRRLNEVVEMLCEPESRAAYDRSLDKTRPSSFVAQPEPSLSSSVPPTLIAGLVFGALAMFCWNIVTSPAAIVPASEPALGAWNAEPPPPVRSHAAAAPVVRGSRGLPAVIVAPEPIPVAAPPVAPDLSLKSEASPPANQPPVDALGPTQSPAPAAHTGPATLEGIWLLQREDRGPLGPGEYAADFIELKLRQRGDHFEGAYRSRYRIPGGAGAPEVNFRFEGAIGEQEFTWSGRNGSRGKVRLNLDPHGVLNLSWVAEARIPGSLLSEGAAKLIRVRTD